MTGQRSRPRAPILSQLRQLEHPAQPQVEQELRRVLISGAVPAGSALPVDGIAAAFGISRIPIRECLRTLLAEGLINHAPHGGYRVCGLTRAEYIELYEVRRALESAALGAAVAQADPEWSSRMEALHQQQCAALAAGDIAAWDSGSRDFHSLLVAPAQMQRLAHLLVTTSNMIGLSRPMTWLALDTLQVLHREHEQMLAAFHRRDVPQLQAAADVHTATLCLALGSN